MDELEIDGKKYLSSRRAAREHKYHTDYIGQLIRAGKVAGKKVGRAWYVDAASLSAYLRAEADGGKTVAAAIQEQHEAEAIVVQPESEVEIEEALPAASVAPEVRQEVTVEPVTARIAEEEIFAEVPAQKIHISIPEKEVFQKKSNTLTYIEDDEPLLPVLEGMNRRNADFVSVAMRRVVEEDEVEAAQEEMDEPAVITERPQARISKKIRVPALVFVGVLALTLAAAGSSLVATSVNVQEGKAASVSLTIK